MSVAAKVLIAAGAALILISFSTCAYGVGLNNELVSLEMGIKAQYKQNQNNYDNMWKKFKEVTQGATMYSEDLKKVYDSAIQGRYGENGSQAMWQWLKEQNPNLDASLYKKIQVVVESGRTSFSADQTSLIDKKRVYETKIAQFPASMVASFLGFPKIDLDEYDIVTSDKTQDAFETKKADEVQLR